ncbi:hypothetical protein K7B06_09600 [Streptomyces erythrochromogenes]|uniref:hypothetical protein n=1 Tax=Streptomyces TaxID=1883 RepID=UPI001601C86D|nr:hypothetical protein [Streptomyces sp. gCLA4]MBZ9595346.1 hypothetical protein [Streptomyces erythrochromogenes]
MENKPNVVVGPPDDVGLRKVVVDGKPTGKVWSLRELQRVLHRAGVTSEHDIEWRGGDGTAWPAQSWRRRITGAVMAVGFLATAAICTWIGFKDSFDALTFAGRVTGFFFLFMAIVELVAFVAVFDYWRKQRTRHSGPALLFGALVEFFVGAVLLLMYVANRETPSDPQCLALYIGLVLCSSWSLWVLCRRRVWKVLRNPGRIAIGAIVSTLLVITNLAYTQVYLPSVSRPLVQGVSEIGLPSLNRDGTKMFVRVRMRLKNSGEVPVHILGSIYWIHVKLASDPKDRFKLIKPGELIKPPGRELNPEEEITEDVVVEIKNPLKLDYEAVTAQISAYAFRQDRMTMEADYGRSGKWRGKLKKEGKDDEPPGPTPANKEYFRYQSNISQSSELLNMTRGRERVTVWWLYRSKPVVYVDVASPGENKVFNLNNPTEQRRAVDRYGLAFVRGSMAQTPYPQLLREAQVRRPK